MSLISVTTLTSCLGCNIYSFILPDKFCQNCHVTIFWNISLYNNRQNFLPGAISECLDLFKMNLLYCGFLARKPRTIRLQLILVPAVITVCTGSVVS